MLSMAVGEACHERDFARASRIRSIIDRRFVGYLHMMQVALLLSQQLVASAVAAREATADAAFKARDLN